MKLADVFTELAAHAERNLRELALDQRASLQRRMALQMIETRFRQMQADGIIDDAEMAELVKSLVHPSTGYQSHPGAVRRAENGGFDRSTEQ